MDLAGVTGVRVGPAEPEVVVMGADENGLLLPFRFRSRKDPD